MARALEDVVGVFMVLLPFWLHHSALTQTRLGQSTESSSAN